jgi:hypothetical protein
MIEKQISFKLTFTPRPNGMRATITFFPDANNRQVIHEDYQEHKQPLLRQGGRLSFFFHLGCRLMDLLNLPK